MDDVEISQKSTAIADHPSRQEPPMDAIDNKPTRKFKDIYAQIKPTQEKSFMRKVWERLVAPSLIVGSALGVSAKIADPNLVDAANLAGAVKDSSSNPILGTLKGTGEFVLSIAPESADQEKVKKAFSEPENNEKNIPEGWQMIKDLKIDSALGKYVLSSPNANEDTGGRYVTSLPRGTIINKAFRVPDETPGNNGGIMYAVEVKDSYKDSQDQVHIVKKYGYITSLEIGFIENPK